MGMGLKNGKIEFKLEQLGFVSNEVKSVGDYLKELPQPNLDDYVKIAMRPQQERSIVEYNHLILVAVNLYLLETGKKKVEFSSEEMGELVAKFITFITVEWSRRNNNVKIKKDLLISEDVNDALDYVDITDKGKNILDKEEAEFVEHFKTNKPKFEA